MPEAGPSPPLPTNPTPEQESTLSYPGPKTPIDHVESVPSGPDPPAPGSQYSTIQWILITLAVYSSALFYGLDTTIVAVVQGPVVERFGDVEKLGWLGIGFPLGSIATIAAWSKGYGIFDTKWMYIGSLVNFAAGSALCGGASNMNGLIVGRVWAGAGGAGMYLGQLNIWTQNTTLKRRSLYISGGGIVWGVGCILGPIVGGAFADSSATWRWAFYINLLLFGFFSPVYFFVLHPHNPRPNSSLSQRLQELDFLGILLNAGTYTTFVIGFTIGGTAWPWNDPRTISTIVLFGILLLFFTLQQSFTILTTPQNRIFPMRFLRSRTFILLYIAQSCVQTALAIPIYYIPLIFQFSRSESTITSSLRLLPLVIVNIVTVFLNGALLPKFDYYMPWYLVSGGFNSIGGALFFATLSLSTSTARIYGYSILLALGTGFAQQAAYTVASAKAGDCVADAIGFINNAQIGSVVVALTLTSLVFQNVGFRNVKQALQGTEFRDQDIRAALGGAKSKVFEDAALSPAVRVDVERAIVEAIRWSFLLVLIAGVVGLGAGMGMRRERLFGNSDTVNEKETKEGRSEEGNA
ncbi:MFS general substrate transporter [Lindgomyces ingoldianus]|uniref:MFS general substrate transporter n=1 Tax=Lindgomyces ingoldianus TaxID=673940 RepID=A0ACB6QS36_9PLEO|nr:MFS general substrate transporter [Lindgomyces ingoldianus]KAF2468892.1 MFS general substrate transporter [Lindgomyces ingoldianus]